MTQIPQKHNGLSYKNAGVSIDAGNDLVTAIGPIAKSTHRTGVQSDLGGFGAVFDLAQCHFKDPLLISSTDGVGTKLKLAFDMGKHDTIGIDLVAMCVNDLIVQGAEPLFFLDYYATSKLESTVAQEVIQGIAEGCKRAGCGLIGGETAEMPGMYKAGHYDLAGFAIGAVERHQLLPAKDITAGDLLLALPSSGVHSNGFSLIHHLLSEKDIGLETMVDGYAVGEQLLTPTTLYVKPCLDLINQCNIKGFSHITGGGLLENIPRILPKDLGVSIDATKILVPPIFHFIQKEGNVATAEMFRTFNMGIGMVAILPAAEIEHAISLLHSHQIAAYTIGKVTKGKHVVELTEMDSVFA